MEKKEEETEIITYNYNIIREEVEIFRKDDIALCAYWHNKDNEMNVLDSSLELHDAINLLKKQGCNNIFIKDISNFDVIILQPKDIYSVPSLPPFDILSSAIGFTIQGYAILVKKECWYCRKNINIERCSKCNITNHCSIICKVNHICNKI